MPPAPDPSAVASSMLSPAATVRLQQARSYPSVSILMRTRPDRRLDEDGRARLAKLHSEALRRLRDEGLDDSPAAKHLAGLVEDARGLPTGRALALFASDHEAQALVLPVGVHDRVVIDPTFATRDLIRALHRTPRHVVLVLSGKEAKLFDGQGGKLSPAAGSKFPLVPEPGRRRTTEAFLGDVDQALGAYLKLHPAPLVIAGAQPTVSKFQALSANVGRLAGIVKGNHLNTPLDQLADATGPLLESYLLGRQQEALGLLERRLGQHRALLGIDAVWLVARWGRPEMLAVEQDFFYPARLSPDGDELVPADELEHPDVIDDVVDEVIELVLDRGGWVALVDSGAIPDGTRIAVTMRKF